MRLIAGDAYGLKNDVKTLSPLFYLHAIIQQGTDFGLPKEHSERAVYVAKGNLEVDGKFYHEGQMLVFSEGVDPIKDVLSILSTRVNARALCLSAVEALDRDPPGAHGQHVRHVFGHGVSREIVL